MNTPIYYTPKLSGTHTDVFTAYGLAALLEEILARVRGRFHSHRVRLMDRGPYFEVTHAGAALTDEELARCPFFVAPHATGFYITGGRDKRASPPGVPARDLNETWEQVRQFAARRSALLDEGVRGTEMEHQLRDSEPPPDWPVVTWLGDGRMQASGIYNGVIERWCATQAHFVTHLKTLLQLAATPDSDVAKIAEGWGKATGQTSRAARSVTSSQLFNPHQGKGQNEPKANALKMDNVTDGFWLLEYLKVIGVWLAAAPRITPDGERKTYVLSPLAITLADHQHVFSKFSRRLWNQPLRNTTSLKLDITSVLLYLQTLLEYSEAGQQEDELDFGIAFDEDFGPEHVVSGMYLTQYRLLSRQAYTVTHLGFLGLPRWTVGARQRADVYQLKTIVEEHLRVIQGIDESHSDGYALLHDYRTFVAGGQWTSFFAFAIRYGGYLMREHHKAYQKGERTRLWQFSENLLEELMSKAHTNLLPILQNQGFKRIAKAIRQSTVQAQYFRYEQNDTRYEVRYGLGQELARKAHDATEFTVALAGFLRDYNAESARIREGVARQHGGTIPAEIKKKLRGSVSEEDVETLLSLIPDFGSEVVCQLLVAVGYSRAAKEEEGNFSTEQ